MFFIIARWSLFNIILIMQYSLFLIKNGWTIIWNPRLILFFILDCHRHCKFDYKSYSSQWKLFFRSSTIIWLILIELFSWFVLHYKSPMLYFQLITHIKIMEELSIIFSTLKGRDPWIIVLCIIEKRCQEGSRINTQG